MTSLQKAPTTQQPGAVVVGGDFHGLGIVRQLGRRSVPVCVIDDEVSISRFSRYATHAVRVRSLRGEHRSIDELLRVGRDLGLRGWVLFPTRDETVASIASQHERVAEFYRPATARWHSVQWTRDKRNTYQKAVELGIPAPKTWYPRDAADLANIEGPFPLTIKPATHERFMRVTKAKAWPARSREELVERYERAAALVGPEQVIIQEFVPGDGRHQYSYCAFRRNGESVGVMVARRRRQHPPDFGRASTYVETCDVPVLEELSARFLDAIEYEGLVEVEYKFDARTREFKLLDVNARTWGYHSLGEAAGVDFAYMQYAHSTGQPVTPARARPGVRWVRLATDIPTGVVEIGGRRLSAINYLRSLVRADTEAVFARDDPLPALAELALIPYLAAKRGY